MNRCPFPGCRHICDVLTNLHCQEEHGMSKDEVIKKHGVSQKVMVNSFARRKNMELFKPMYKVN